MNSKLKIVRKTAKNDALAAARLAALLQKQAMKQLESLRVAK